MKKIYVIYLIRYGEPTLGRYLFGFFDNPEKAHLKAKSYNEYRGGKYPQYEIIEYAFNEVLIFENRFSTVSSFKRETSEKISYRIAKLSKIFKNDIICSGEKK